MPSPRWSRQQLRLLRPAPSWRRPSWRGRRRPSAAAFFAGAFFAGAFLAALAGASAAVSVSTVPSPSAGATDGMPPGISRVARSGLAAPAEAALGRPVDVLGERGLGEDDLVGDQHVVGVELAGLDQVHLRRVAQAHPVEDVVAVEDHEHPLGLGDAVQRRQRGLGLRGVTVDERGDHVHPALAGPVGEGTAQGGGLHLLRGLLRVVARRSDRRRCHRRRTAARGSNPDGRDRCPSGGTAWRHHR